MGYDLEELKFIGTAGIIAESEFAASFDDDCGSTLGESLYREYQAAGSPKNRKAWIRKRLGELFLCLEDRPRWIESSPIWPFHESHPMTFIGQLSVPANEISQAHLSPETELYVFGTRVQEGEGWVMKYSVITQHFSLP